MTPNTVYGSLMHHRAELRALGDAVHQAPYIAPPHAPVLYIKPANTFSAFNQTLHCPTAQTPLHARACVGLIYEPNQPIAPEEYASNAIKNVANSDWKLSVFCDFTLPHTSFYRPPLRFNAWDGSLALPKRWLDWPDLSVETLRIETWVNGQYAHTYSSADWVLTAQAQLQAVSEFIAWENRDVLMLGCPPDAPLVKAGDVVETRLGGEVFTRTLISAEEAA